MERQSRVAQLREREVERLRALGRAALLDTPPEEEFDRVCRLAADVLRAPLALVTLFDADRLFFKSQVGLPEPLASRREARVAPAAAARDAGRGPLVVSDSRTDPSATATPIIAVLGLVAYAGVPLITNDEHPLGSLCVGDHQPRDWSASDLRILDALARVVAKEIELRSLARAAAALAAVIDRLPDGVIVADTTGSLVLVNAAAAQLHGMADVAVPGAPVTLEGPPEPAPDLPAVRSAASVEPVAGARWRIGPDDGTERVAVGSATPIVLGDVPYGSVLIVPDVAEKRARDRERGAFLATIAHDLKNPLTVIKGTAQMLQMQHARTGEVSGQRLISASAAIHRAVARMVGQLDEVFDSARDHLGQPLELHPEQTDLVALAREAVADYTAAGDANLVHLGPAEDSLIGWWDTTRLQRVLANLLSNAIKYSPNAGEITVAVRRVDEGAISWAQLTVADHGIGIPASDLPHIFERFRRASNVPRVLTGTGIGLSDVLQTVQWHGGSVRVESEEGAGSIFTVSLPLNRPPPPEHPATRERA